LGIRSSDVLFDEGNEIYDCVTGNITMNLDRVKGRDSSPSASFINVARKVFIQRKYSLLQNETLCLYKAMSSVQFHSFLSAISRNE
jgi:hypothetical protein